MFIVSILVSLTALLSNLFVPTNTIMDHIEDRVAVNN